jgi:methyl-accepting chemotaxis protein
VFAWDLSHTRHVAVAEPLSHAGWSYAAALPLAEVESDARAFLRQAVLAALVGLLAAWVLSAVVARRVVQAIRRLIAVSQHIVTRNDLTHRVEAASDDEVGQLAESFSLMVSALRDALTTLQSASGALLEAAEQLRTTTESERELLGRQASALQQTQVTAKEIFVPVTEQLAMMQQTQQRLESTSAASASVREQAARVSALLARYVI